MPKGKVFTWGYRGREPVGLLCFCLRHRINRVIDVRRNARDGRIQKGWHWPAWCLCFAPEITCEWQAALGNYWHGRRWKPRDRREANLLCQAIGAQVKAGETILLFCAEPDAKDCHRREVAEKIAEAAGGAEIIHL